MTSGSGPPAHRCSGYAPTILGTPGNDRIRGTEASDIILTRSGRDRIAAGRGNDIVCAGPGNDDVLGGPGADDVSAGNHRDAMIGGPGADRLRGAGGWDLIEARLGSRDTCDGGPPGNDDFPRADVAEGSTCETIRSAVVADRIGRNPARVR